MIDKIKNWFYKPEELENANTPQHKTEVFILSIDKNVIGVLSLNAGIWHFQYSEWFAQQNTYSELIDFPNKLQSYQSKELWPFFASRIPGLKQPMVEAIIEREKINRSDISALLKRFGINAIQNPYRLQVQ